MRQKGFTLVELLLVLAIIGILTGIAVPALLGQRERSKSVAARANASAVETEITHQINFDLPPEKIISNLVALSSFKYPNTKNPYGGEADIIVNGAPTSPGQVGLQFLAGGGVKPDGTAADIIRITWLTREGGAVRTYSKDVPLS